MTQPLEHDGAPSVVMYEGLKMMASGWLLGGIALAGTLLLLTNIKLFPLPVLGVILFLTGGQLALGSCDLGEGKNDRFVTLTTAAFSMWNIGLAFVFGMLLHHALRRGWVKL